jgi:hypothetical protein
VTPDDIDTAKAAIADAEKQLAHEENAIPGAKVKVMTAEQGIVAVLREHCKRLGAPAMAEGLAMQARGNDLLFRGGTINTRGKELLDIGNKTNATLHDVRRVLANAARDGIA